MPELLKSVYKNRFRGARVSTHIAHMTRVAALVDSIHWGSIANDRIACTNRRAVVEQRQGLRQSTIVCQWSEVEIACAGEIGVSDIQSATANGWQGAVAQIEVHRDEVVGDDGSG